MIRVTRLPAPQVLQDKADTWTAEFIASGEKRPPHRRYRHADILSTLVAMSRAKCMYCEAGVPEDAGVVEHRVAIAFDKTRAFDWSNLFWACKSCNDRKLEETQIAASHTLDPTDLTVDPEDHITFDLEAVTAVKGSALGSRTIQKFRLDRGDLDLARSKHLNQFQRRFGKLDQTGKENLLAQMIQSDRPFAGMYRSFLRDETTT